MKRAIIWSGILLFLGTVIPTKAQVLEQTPRQILIDARLGNWFCGVISKGALMPIANGYQVDMTDNCYGNQAQPLLLSTMGDVVWCEEPISVICRDDSLWVESQQGILCYHKAGKTLREAYQYASKNYFHFDGRTPSLALFETPQYNTWIELMYNQNQADILRYAQAIVDNGFPPGVLMIDDNWQEDYGTWTFHPGRFPDPKAMIAQLHQMGFKVMLWICPYISPDSYIGRDAVKQGVVLKTTNNSPALIHWWNGYSHVLDLSNPAAGKWFHAQLEQLCNEYGVDGFKFDAGDAEAYAGDYKPFGADVTGNDQTELYARIGLRYPLNEYRANWKMGGLPIANRLSDKQHKWEDIRSLIPNMILEGLMGYPFSCPDMIGGGEFNSFLDATKLDQELIVRSAQCHALMPMMQFSVAPWRVLDSTHQKAIKESVALRLQFTPYILRTIQACAKTGEPALRPLEYNYPHQGYIPIKDQFMMGDSLLVAPVLEKGVTSREVVLPQGVWRDAQGKKIKGPATVKQTVKLNTLPYFWKIR